MGRFTRPPRQQPTVEGQDGNEKTPRRSIQTLGLRRGLFFLVLLLAVLFLLSRVLPPVIVSTGTPVADASTSQPQPTATEQQQNTATPIVVTATPRPATATPRPPTATPELATSVSQPSYVSIPGTIDTLVGCSADWMPDCTQVRLAYTAESGVWMRTFGLPAGDYEYKVALNGAWDENYGANGERGGANISLKLRERTTVRFVYDHKTHWVADSVNSIIANVAGSFQSELGCPDTLFTDPANPGDWSPGCLRTWLQDPDGNGIYTFTTEAIPKGDWEAKVALNLSWDENYGANGERDGANIPFTVSGNSSVMVFEFNSQTKRLVIYSR